QPPPNGFSIPLPPFKPTVSNAPRSSVVAVMAPKDTPLKWKMSVTVGAPQQHGEALPDGGHYLWSASLKYSVDGKAYGGPPESVSNVSITDADANSQSPDVYAVFATTG